MKRIAVAALALLLAGCSNNPFNVDGERRATEEERAHFLAVYAQTSGCLGMTGDGDRVRWWIAKLVTFDNKLHAGAHRRNDIWLHDTYGLLEPTIAHESMHHILYVDGYGDGHGDNGHTHPEWRTCGRAEWR